MGLGHGDVPRHHRAADAAHHLPEPPRLAERERCPAAAECDFVFVNLFAEPLGAPMRPGRVVQLFASLSRCASLGRTITPHMLRHAAGSALAAHGGLDVCQAVLGHASIISTQVYVHVSVERQREAVERVARATASRRVAVGESDVR